MTKFAARTQVPENKTRAEIEQTLVRYGASAFAYGWKDGAASVQFEMANRRVRLMIHMPQPTDPAFLHTPTGQQRSAAAATTAWEQAYRQRWRALLLLIKAQLEAIESGIVTFDEVFLAHIALPGGGTIGEATIPQLESAYTPGDLPALLPPKRG